MNKTAVRTGMFLGILLGTTIIVYAVTTLFFTKTERSELSKKTVFRFDMSTDMEAASVGPGDSFSVQPYIFNDATEDMFVFIRIDMPETESGKLYTYTTDDQWIIVSDSTDGYYTATTVYAYAGAEMTSLFPGESTTTLTTELTMEEISNAEYAYIDDINIRLTGYAIGTDEISTSPEEAWEKCKAIGNIE